MEPLADSVRSFALPLHATSRNDKGVRMILGNSITCVMSFRDNRTICGGAGDQDGKSIAMLVQLPRMQTVNYRLLRSQAFRVWKQWVCA